MGAGWRDDASITVSPTTTTTYTVTATDSSSGSPVTASATITVIPALSCTVAPASKTIDSGQSVTLTRHLLERDRHGGVLVDAGWRDDVVDHGLPDGDDDVHGDGDRLDRWCCRYERVLVDDHGEPGAGVHGVAGGEDD